MIAWRVIGAADSISEDVIRPRVFFEVQISNPNFNKNENFEFLQSFFYQNRDEFVCENRGGVKKMHAHQESRGNDIV